MFAAVPDASDAPSRPPSARDDLKNRTSAATLPLPGDFDPFAYPARANRRRAYAALALALVAGCACEWLLDRPGGAVDARLLAASSLAAAETSRPEPAGSIGQLSEHFSAPWDGSSPWVFVPDGAVKEFSTTEHPGLAVVWDSGAGLDIKGITRRAIGIADYKLPWEFQLGLMQNFSAETGFTIRTQANYAIGLNLALTFSDPATWPADRARQPPDTRSLQLLACHVGSTGESSQGLPQYTTQPHPETYLIWGRGDLGYAAMGDWEIPHIWAGDGSRNSGPASDLLYFRCVIHSPTEISVGVKFNAAHGWNMRHVNVGQYGRITGIWEVGPIFSGDRWIPDVLCRSLPHKKGPHPLLLGEDDEPQYRPNWRGVRTPTPEPPNPKFEYYVDYCAFLPSNPRPFDEYSDEFDITGYFGRWQIQPQGTIAETYSHPGNLLLTLLGPSLGTGFGPVGVAELDLTTYPPPWEIEICFTEPDDSVPWNLFMNFSVYDGQGVNRGVWQPGVQNLPAEKRHVPLSINGGQRNPWVDVVFSQPVPEEVLAHKPLRMLIQVLDKSHVRLGFRGDERQAWHFSDTCDVGKTLEGGLTKLGMHVWSLTTGRHWRGAGGEPAFQRLLVDYVRYRYGTTN